MLTLLRSIVTLLIHFVLISAVACGGSFYDGGSIYEILSAHGLPMGLLPKGITEFHFDDAGRFEVHLDQACNAMFESQLHFDRNVSGSLGYAEIGDLSGIYAQELFLWFPVKGIRVDVPSSGLIHFDVGVVFKQFSLSLFETPRDCMAVRALDPIRDGNLMAEKIAQSPGVNLRRVIDQETFMRDVL